METSQTQEQQPTLEELFQNLEDVARHLEDEAVTLEESFTLYHQGMQLLKKCNEIIDTVEKKVMILDENGEEHEF